MTGPDRYARLMSLFDRACDMRQDEHEALLAGLRARDPALASDLRDLLQSDRRTGDLFDSDDGRIDLAASLRDDGDCETTAVTRVMEEPGRPASGSPAPRRSERRGELIGGRYRLEELLGAGAMGEVFRARDGETDTTVAVKLLHRHLVTDPRQVTRFRREFRAVARINHPGCLAVLAEGEHRGARYLVSEYVAGGNLNRLIGAPSEVLVPVLVKLAVALDCIHRRRIVHRDLKPANVLLSAGDPPQPKIADFGIVKLGEPVGDANGDPAREEAPGESLTGLTDTGAVLGTLDYLAPEQLEGGDVDARCDLYALGCVMFKLWAGRTPFVGSPFKRLQARIDQVPPRLADHAPSLPDGIDELVARLLERDRDRRPQHAAEVAQALARVHRNFDAQAVSAATALSDPEDTGPGPLLYKPHLVGRRSVLAAIDERVAAVRRGDAAGVVALYGPAGLGKSAVAEALRRELEAAGQRVILVAGRLANHSPFEPFPTIADVLARELGADPDPTDGPTTNPFARGGGGAVSEMLIDEGAVARRKLAEQVAERLCALEVRRPTTLILEDFHEANPAARALLAELQAMLRAASASDGDGDGDSDGDARSRPVVVPTVRCAGRDELARALGTVEVAGDFAIEPLAAAELRAMTAAMLAVPEASVPDALVQHLARACGGSPLLVQSALQALVDRGAMSLTPSGWHLDEEQLDEALTTAVGDVLFEGLSVLSAVTRRILGVAAVCRDTFDIDVLASAADLPEDTVLDALDEAIRASVIAVVEGQRGSETYRFRHALLADALRSQLPESDVARLHDSIGTALSTRADVPPAALAFHFHRGTDPRLALSHCLAAGRAAQRARDYEAAAHHFERALEHVDDLPAAERSDAGAACLEPLADAQLACGRTSSAIANFRALANRDSARASRARALVQRGERQCELAGVEPHVEARRLRKLGLALFRTEDVASGLATLRRALAVLGDSMPRRRLVGVAQVLADMAATALGGLVRRVIGRKQLKDPVVLERALLHRELSLMSRWINLEQTLLHQVRFFRLAQRLSIKDLSANAHAAAALTYALLALPGPAGRNHRRARELAVKSGNRRGLASAAIFHGATETLLRHDEAAAMQQFDEALHVADSLGDRVLESFASTMRGWGGVVLGGGGWNQAAEDFRRGQKLAAELEIPWLHADATCGRGMVGLFQGDFELATRSARSVLAWDIRMSLPVFEAVATEILGGEAFLRGRFVDAATFLGRAQAQYSLHRVDRGWGLLVDVEHAEALLCLADEQGADAVPDLIAHLRRAARRARRRMGRFPLYRGCHLMMRGVIAARRGKARAARRLFRRARAVRGDGGRGYMDTWFDVRITLERWRLGAPRAETAARLDAIDETYRAIGLHGWRTWLARMREIHAV